jgi:large subunit ribosomal protein L25
MDIQSLNVTVRDEAGKCASKKVRVEGNVPCVLYGGDQEPLGVIVNRKQFETMILHSRSGEHAILKLEVEGNPDLSTPALVKAVQHHPLRGQIVHADFLRIRLDERIETLVQVRIVGQAVGVVEGGVIDQQMREIEVECLALEVPDEIVVDVTNLHVGDAIHVSDLPVPENVTVLTDADRPVVAVHAPRVVKEVAAGEEAEEGEAGTEPEVISEKKDKEKDKDKGKDKD